MECPKCGKTLNQGSHNIEIIKCINKGKRHIVNLFVPTIEKRDYLQRSKHGN